MAKERCRDCGRGFTRNESMYRCTTCRPRFLKRRKLKMKQVKMPFARTPAERRKDEKRKKDEQGGAPEGAHLPPIPYGEAVAATERGKALSPHWHTSEEEKAQCIDCYPIPDAQQADFPSRVGPEASLKLEPLK